MSRTSEKSFIRKDQIRDIGTSSVLGLLNFIALCLAANYGRIPSFAAAAFFFAVMLVALVVETVFLYNTHKSTVSQPNFGSPYVGDEQSVVPTEAIPNYNSAERQPSIVP
ncbi:unnamed protein product [Dibothriocephalus latus]|uniref:Uncharacterized protein n=1 Tax=Dibothriocephalus latus TaxID=60516 RepID=A0A3P7LJH2_DIBLA|nr:unnamed protein product [Dibothriocephalus latus]